MIGIFDSGVGGLGIFSEIKRLLPKESIVYIADSKNCPYGEKSIRQIQKICQTNTKLLLEAGADIIVIACNSASVSALNYLRTKFPKTPIVGVVPVIKTAVAKTKNKKIGVLGTRRTVSSKYLKALSEEFAPEEAGYQVFYRACGNLVEVVEQEEDNDIFVVLTGCLKKFLEEDVDVVVLGCTHFPFAKDEIKKVLGRKVKILDSNAAVARQVKRIVAADKQSAKNKQTTYKFYTSGNVKQITKISRKLLRDNDIEFESIK